MLQRLVVENLAVVERSEIVFGPNLNVLTGETGAGKSILIDALKLLVEKKYPPHIIREGQEITVVEALFSHKEDETVLRREVSAGRSSALINGRLATFVQIRECADGLLAIHGQRDHDFLLNESNHRRYLDLFAGGHELLAGLAAEVKNIRRASRELEKLEERRRRRTERLELLGFQIAEIDALGLAAGQEEELQNRLAILAASEEILSRSEELLNLMYSGEPSVHSLLARGLEHGQALAGFFPDLAVLHEEMERFQSLVPEIARRVQSCQENCEFDPSAFDELAGKQQRLARLKTRHQTDLDGLLQLAGDWRRERDELLGLDLQLEDLQQEIASGLEKYSLIQLDVRRLRRRAASELELAVGAELAKLEMKHACFQVGIEERSPSLENLSENGCDRIRFFFSANPGQPAGPLSEVASGGELSRLMLVLQALGRDEKDITFIFDEIDAGIGGRTAEFVGEKLRQIAARNQVICISHLPQIASFADHHFQVSKEVRGSRTFSSVQQLDLEERRREIARLMAGTSSHEDVLKAAARLLEKNSR